MEDRSNLNPILDELRRLDAQIEEVPDLGALKPIFYRIEQINKEHPAEFEVQLLVSDVKQHLVNRGMLLKQQGSVGARQTSVGTKTTDPGLKTSGSFTSNFPELSSHPTPVPMNEPLPAHEPLMMPEPVAAHPITESASALHEVYIPPVRQTPPPAPPPPPSFDWKKPALIGGSIGLALTALVMGGIIISKKKNPPPKVEPVDLTLIPVEVVTSPSGAAVRVNNEPKGKSTLRLDLKPGTYKMDFTLPGYLPAFQDITVAAGHPVFLNLTLAPQSQTLRIFTDLKNGGQVFLDDKPSGALQDGQQTIDSVAPGAHTLRIAQKPGTEAKFAFQVAPGTPTSMTGPLTANNLVAVVASSFGDQIHLETSGPPLKVSLDGAAKGDSSPTGMDITGVTQGDHEIELNDGKEERKLVVSVGPSPVITAWVNADTSGGTLVVMAGEDGATVSLDGKPYPRKTKRGQLWIPNLAPKDYKITVAKEGFQDVADQTAQVKRGAEARLTFKLQAIPKIAVLHVKEGTPGAEVFVDKDRAGAIETDGTLSFSNVQPGEHTVEIRKDQYVTKAHKLNFPPGQTVELTGEAVTLAKATGTLKITVSPADAQIFLRGPEGRRAVQPGTYNLPMGSYTLVARAPGYNEASTNVVVNQGEQVNAELRLPKEGGAIQQKPAVKSDWEHPGEWTPDSGWIIHKGGGFVPYAAHPAVGVFTFAAQLVKGGRVFGGKRIQWYLNYEDSKNYILFQIDKKSLQSKIVADGKETQRPKVTLNTDEPFTLQIEVGPNSIIHKLREENTWTVIDTLSRPGVGAGKFGFLIPGNDELAISNFTFTPR
ncbi:MAG TPA: PEGA domain-containing protein [Bryobacteraceae bacterium]|nr:PEGA domain-containing protein [Bryobacteraceae bacterium]